MGLLDWLWSGPRFRRHPEVYALTRAALMQGLVSAIDRQRQQSRTTLVLAHFPATFEELDLVFQDRQFDSEVLTREITEDLIAEVVRSSQPGIYLTLADMIQPSTSPRVPRRVKGELAVMVTELHPLPEKDARIERFARRLPLRVRLGYFLSLEDPVIRRNTNKTTVRLLAQLGLENHDLISSHMVSRQVRRAMRRAMLIKPDETNSRSAEEWYARNLSKQSGS